MKLEASELILNKDGSIYHLGLLPEELASTIILVGDPDRVPRISKYFDKIDVEKQKRELRTHTGIMNGKRISVVSTGMGTDNIDIVLTELDALVNIDFEKKAIKEDLKTLNIIRIGTSGSIQPDIPVDSFVISEKALGFDGLLYYYESEDILEKGLASEFVRHTGWSDKKAYPYVVPASAELVEKMTSDKTHKGITGTNIGFYGPQGRILRLGVSDKKLNDKITSFNYKGERITNLEMETSAIYGLSKLLGHKAVSMNAILANRTTGEFSKDPGKLVNDLIEYTLDRIP